MAKASGGRPDANRRSAALFAQWVGQHADLLRGLRALRDLGADGEEAVEAVLALPEVRFFKVSWELWALLAHDQGINTESLLLQHVSREALDLAGAALLGHPRLSRPVVRDALQCSSTGRFPRAGGRCGHRH